MDKYEIGSFIGRGTSGSIELVRRKLDKSIFAMKTLFLSSSIDETVSELRHEAELQQTLKHPSIVGLVEFFPVPEENTLNMIIQHCEGGDLDCSIRQIASTHSLIPEPTIWYMFLQLLLGVEYLHHERVLHRDIKPQNIFLTTGTFVKIGDVGISRQLGSKDDLSRTFTGTPFYMSPEQISHKPYGFPSDMWSLGCIVYTLTTLQRPFSGSSTRSITPLIQNAQYPPITGQYPKHINRTPCDANATLVAEEDSMTYVPYSTELKTVIDELFSIQPEQRPTAAELLRMKAFHDPLIAYATAVLQQYKKDRSNALKASTTAKQDASSSSPISPTSTNSTISPPIKSPLKRTEIADSSFVFSFQAVAAFKEQLIRLNLYDFVTQALPDSLRKIFTSLRRVRKTGTVASPGSQSGDRQKEGGDNEKVGPGDDVTDRRVSVTLSPFDGSPSPTQQFSSLAGIERCNAQEKTAEMKNNAKNQNSNGLKNHDPRSWEKNDEKGSLKPFITPHLNFPLSPVLRREQNENNATSKSKNGDGVEKGPLFSFSPIRAKPKSVVRRMSQLERSKSSPFSILLKDESEHRTILSVPVSPRRDFGFGHDVISQTTNHSSHSPRKISMVRKMPVKPKPEGFRNTHKDESPEVFTQNTSAQASLAHWASPIKRR